MCRDYGLVAGTPGRAGTPATAGTPSTVGTRPTAGTQKTADMLVTAEAWQQLRCQQTKRPKHAPLSTLLGFRAISNTTLCISPC
jgi:hypothetical protein